jgi:peptidoglycan/xylan/chitin deacetylase (PgdA/CDA1 family)
VVLWRPFHEMNGGWFWWGAKDPETFIRVWRHMFDYFTKTKGLDNLLWVYSPNHGNKTAAYYAGDQYVDLVGLDAYTDFVDPQHIAGYEAVAKLPKPFGFTEFGPHGPENPPGNYDYLRFLEGVKKNFPKTTFFLAWHAKWSLAQNQNTKELLENPWLVNREDLPASFAAPGGGAEGAKTPGKPAQVVILKLDDVTALGAQGRVPISARWQRTADFLEKSGIKGSFGIIGWSLEQDNQPYFDWIKRLHRKGNIEFWNHGYRDRKAEDKTGEFEEPLEVQAAAIQKTQRLAKEKLGIELKVFGQHWSGTTADTEKALATAPEIKAWFYGPKSSKKFVFEDVMAMENPIFVPDPDKFKELYESRAKDKPCLTLQGHPDQWDESRWQGFVKIVEFLKAKGCVFMTPSQYMETVSGAGR